MKDITQFLLEAKFDADTKVSIGDSALLQSFLKNDIENLEGNIRVTGDGIKYNNVLVPGTKLSLKLTAGEYEDILIDYINNTDEMKNKANANLVVKKTRKNAGIPRGSYGAKEKMDARAAARNKAVINGDV